MRNGFFFIIFSLGVTAHAAEKITYEQHVRPIFKQHCLNCHNPDKSKGDLDLATYKALLAGSSSGEIVVPGNADASALYLVMTHAEEPEMPPKKPKLPAKELDLIKKWITGGIIENAGGTAKKSDKRSVNFDVVASPDGGVKGVPVVPENLPKVKMAKNLRPHPITAMAASAWAPVAAVAGHESILLYNTETREQLGVLPFPERIPYVLKFSRNGELLLAAGGRGAHSGKVVIFDVKTGERKTEIGDEFDVVLAADISADHRFVALGGPGKLVKIYSVANGKELHKIKKHTDWVTAMEFSPDGSMLASGDRSGGLHVWDPEGGSIIFTLDAHKQQVTEMAWRADSELLVSVAEDGKLVMWDTIEGWAAKTVVPHKEGKKDGSVLSVAYAKDGCLATAGRNKSVGYLTGSGSFKASFDAFEDLPTRVAFTHDGKHVLAGDFEGRVQVWDPKEKRRVGFLGQ